jgi:hypothetical protein
MNRTAVLSMKRFFPFAALVLAVAASQAGAQPLQVDVPANVQPVQSGLTRAEVVADYHLWRLAGLQELTRGEQSADTNSYQYRKAFATYLHLRQSPQFAQLVSELENKPNARVAASRSANTRVLGSN